MALRMKNDQGMREIQKTLTIRCPAEELYAVWKDLERLPQFMDHVASITTSGDARSHWVVKAPAGRTVEWDAQMRTSEPELIAWHSLPGASVRNEGEVRFLPAPEDRGTEVTVTLRYEPPAGGAGATVAAMFGEEPSQQLDDDLYRFKQLMESGHIPTTAGQSHGER